MPRGNTRALILQAALNCFLQDGVAGTSIAAIRAKSGATTGSIYHFFTGKEDIALALCAEGLRSWADAVCAVPRDGTPERVIRSMVESAIDWALANDFMHRFLLQGESLIPIVSRRSDMVDALMEARLNQERILRDLTDRGAIRPLPWDLSRAIILGPVESYLRARVQGNAAATPEEAKVQLGASAWVALRTSGEGGAGLDGVSTEVPARAKKNKPRRFDLI